MVPATGARFTCTSKIFRKMLMRFKSGLSAFTATTLPSAGETATGPAGMTRCGSRKKYRQNSASTHSGAPNHGFTSQETMPPAPAKASA